MQNLMCLSLFSVLPLSVSWSKLFLESGFRVWDVIQWFFFQQWLKINIGFSNGYCQHNGHSSPIHALLLSLLLWFALWFHWIACETISGWHWILLRLSAQPDPKVYHYAESVKNSPFICIFVAFFCWVRAAFSSGMKLNKKMFKVCRLEAAIRKEKEVDWSKS